MTRIIMTPEIAVKERCPICSKNSIETLQNKEGDYIYWGCEATEKCSKCGRLVCSIHISADCCWDCTEEKDLGYGRGGKTAVKVTEEKTEPTPTKEDDIWKAFGRKENENKQTESE